MDTFATFAGYRLHSNINMTKTVPGPMRDRTWRERLFTFPWRPWVARTRTWVTVPDDDVYVVDMNKLRAGVQVPFGAHMPMCGKVIMGHPDTLRRIVEGGSDGAVRG